MRPRLDAWTTGLRRLSCPVVEGLKRTPLTVAQMLASYQRVIYLAQGLALASVVVYRRQEPLYLVGSSSWVCER